MNRLDPENRDRMLHMLCEGQSFLAIARAEGCSKNTVAKLLADAGNACTEYQDRVLRNLCCQRVEVDEVWSFACSNQMTTDLANGALDHVGDMWTWTAIDADSKLVLSWMVGKRDGESAMAFMDDLHNRLANRVQLASNGNTACLEAVKGATSVDVDYAQLLKLYGDAPETFKGRCSSALRTNIAGESQPHRDQVSTSYVEHQNLTRPMHMRRFTRLANASSEKVEKHASALALHFMYYNFVRINQTTKVSPAMAAGVADRLWAVSDILTLLEKHEAEATPKKRGP